MSSPPCPKCERNALHVDKDKFGYKYISCICGFMLYQSTLEKEAGINSDENTYIKKPKQVDIVLAAIAKRSKNNEPITIDIVTKDTGLTRTQVRLIVNRLANNQRVIKSGSSIMGIAA